MNENSLLIWSLTTAGSFSQIFRWLVSLSTGKTSLVRTQPVAFPVNFPASRTRTRGSRRCGTHVRSCPKPITTTSGEWTLETLGQGYLSLRHTFPGQKAWSLASLGLHSVQTIFNKQALFSTSSHPGRL